MNTLTITVAKASPASHGRVSTRKLTAWERIAFKKAKGQPPPSRPTSSEFRIERGDSYYVDTDEFALRAGVPVEAVRSLIVHGKLPSLTLPGNIERIPFERGIEALRGMERASGI